MESKIAWRWPLGTDSLDEAYRLVKPVLGEPRGLERGEDGYVDWLKYGPSPWDREACERLRDAVGVVRDLETGQLGCEFVLAWSLDGGRAAGYMPEVAGGLPLPHGELVREWMRGIGFEGPDGRFYAYEWYNGCDEPVRVHGGKP